MGTLKVAKFNKRISFYEEKKVVTAIGDTEKIKSKIYECWACVKEQYSNDIKATAGTILENSVQFLIRKSFDAKSMYTIRYNGVEYKIIKVVKDPLNNKHTTIYAERTG